MRDAAIVAEERARLKALERANRFNVTRATAVSVDAVNLTALVDPGDGRRITVYPVDGTLPAPGDVVSAFRYGDDWFMLGNTLLASGSKTSLGHVPGSEGWGQHANGDFEANNGYFRGTVAAAEFMTSEDDTAARVVISAADDARSVLLYTDDVDELTPGALTSFTDATREVVRIRSGEFTAGGAGKHANVDVGIDPDTGATFGEAIADDWRVNGVSISRPPYAAYRRVADLGPILPSTSTSQAILWDTLLKVNFASALPYDAGTGNFAITRPGIYSAALIWIWGDSGNSAGDGHRRIRLEETIPGQATTQRTIDSRVGVGGGISTVHNCTADIVVGTASVTAPFLVRFFAGHVSISSGQPSAALYGTGRVSIRRVSD